MQAKFAHDLAEAQAAAAEAQAEARDERLTEKRLVGDGIDQPSAAEPGKDQAPALDLGPFRERREGNLASRGLMPEGAK